jgi:AcrR family transcriptional regulator
VKSKRERILVAGRELFMKNGIQSTSMEQIAETVPVSKMTIYKYFQSKEGLLEQVVQQFAEDIYAKFRSTIDNAKDPLDALEKLTAFWEQDEISEVFMKDLADYPALVQKLMSYTQERFVPEAEQLIFQGQQLGMLRKDISPHVLLVFMMGLKQYFMQPQVLQTLSELRSTSEQIYSIVYHGIIAPDYKKQ